MCLICASAESPGVLPPLAVPADHWEAGRAFLERHPSVDIHAHPGRFFMSGAPMTSLVKMHAPPDPDRVVEDMRGGGVSAAFFATVADLPVLEQGERGLRASRPFSPGEAIADHERQLASARAVFERQEIALARTGADIAAAHEEDDLAGLLAIEGGDFIEDRLERVAEAAAGGVRMITIIHYRTNQIGDTQTEVATHGGLTALGRATIAAMEAADILVDLSHASYDAVRQAVAIATRPMILSHSNIAPVSGSHPRLISPDHARMVAGTGGVVGCVPAGFAQSSLDDYADTILRTIDTIGIDHVAIGTDMDFTYRSVMPSYRHWPALAGTLLARGLDEDEAAKIMGGNAMRILQ